MYRNVKQAMQNKHILRHLVKIQLFHQYSDVPKTWLAH